MLFGSAFLFSSALLYGAKEVGLWHMSSLKATIYWFVGTGVVLVGNAVTDTASRRALLARVARRVIATTILIEFIVNVYALPLAYELGLIPIALVLLGLRVVAQQDASLDPRVLKAINGMLMLVGLIYLAYFLVRSLGDLNGLVTREHAEEFLVGPVLTLALIPFLCGVAWVSMREQENLRSRFRAATNAGG